MKKIVLISVGQPSTNPRLVKEANTLANAGFDVYVIYSYWTQWAWEADKLLFKKIKWTPMLAAGSPFEDKLAYFLSRLRVKLFGFIAAKLTLKYGIAEIAKGRTYPALVKKAASIKADLYIAHVQAALPAAVNAAKKNNAKCGFDAEDFHRNEVSDDVNSVDYRISKYIEDKYLPEVDYITASSPLIAKCYSELYKRAVTVLLNVFPAVPHPVKVYNKTEPLMLFWFSQTISSARGVSDCINALHFINNPAIELHLLGHADSQTKQLLTKIAGDRVTLVFHEPIAPDEIIQFASNFDVGLAMEDTMPYNRDICLTNKIFTYMKAGLAIIASDTSAQKSFMNDYPGVGEVYINRDIRSIARAISFYFSNPDQLYSAKKASYKIAFNELNWEKESKKFLQIINNTLSS